jgi:hypothetical protein
MHIRENFLHHSLDVPGLVGRHAIQFDDHFGAISNCSGNVLYKAAGIGIATSGSGNNVVSTIVTLPFTFAPVKAYSWILVRLVWFHDAISTVTEFTVSLDLGA